MRLDIKNANSPTNTKTSLTSSSNHNSNAAAAILREKSNLVNDRKTRGHRSLGDLHELINKYKSSPREKKTLTRKSDGKEYKMVRREYIY